MTEQSEVGEQSLDKPLEADNAGTRYKVLPFEFTGDTLEYFQIWIVNALLCVLTLGLFSAWAKVRTERYFYANTLLSGSPFEYLGEPIKILKGRLLIVFCIVAYGLGTLFFPAIITDWIFVLGVIFLWPWLTVVATRFRARNTAYRHIRFDFYGGLSEARKVYFEGYGIVAITFGLAYPLFVWMRHKFRIDNARYGTLPLTFNASNSKFFNAYGSAFCLLMFASLGGLLITRYENVIGSGIGLFLDNPETLRVFSNYIVVSISSCFILFIVTYIRVTTLNTLFMHTRLGRHRFSSTLKVFPLFWIYLSNIIAIIFSVGLLIPWAKIRAARYRLANIKFLVDGDLDMHVAQMQHETSEIGADTSEMLDMDPAF